ncbi:hypothetical protein HII31_04813 [Pseudocercospora fuligena]|uniref:DUF7709 domain-containing protein n=1 Tax=Pseudocercospora fuligena TaxID=685502 RepID=A0A8H6RMN5_9PEZI|nr:hypothetical protein HII31_04813 [Pseudocercospora fuligena]
MSSDQNNQTLHEINKRLLKDPNESLPQITLADGTKIQTGTVGALMQNIKLYDHISKEQLEQMMAISIPTLKKSGLLDVFPPEEWIAGTSAGRKFVGQKAKDMGH